VNGGVPPITYLWSNGATTQNLSGLEAGPYTVVITDNAGCTATGTYTLTQPPQLVADAGENVTICGLDNYVMQAAAPVAGIGFWTAITYPGINTFSDSTSNSATVSNLQEGDNVFLWTVKLGNCTNSTQVTITRGTSIDAFAGTDQIICESTFTLSATNPQFGFGFWRAFTPGVVIDNSSAALTDVFNLQLGNNVFLWTVISGNCRDSAEINVFRKDSLDCLSIIRIPTAFSPNNDGYNDVFLIKGLFDFPDNNLTIFNRWGVIVYESNNYQNNWDGRGKDNVPVTDGTYFIMLRIQSQDKVYTGYLDLRR
jgi:gliding motility-associated-like protein